MNRILMVSPVPTHPVTAGNRARICSLKLALEQAGHKVFFAHIERETGDREAMRDYWGDHYLPFGYTEPKSPIRRLLRRTQRKLGFASGHQLSLDAWYDDALSAQIGDAISALNIDTLLVHYLFMSKALTAAPDTVLKLLDTHDSFANRHLQYLEAGLPPNWYSCSEQTEAAGIARADVAMAIQHQEASYFEQLGATKVITVGHTVELAEPTESYPSEPNIVAVGSANPINQKSLVWFIEEVLPAVRSRVAQAELHIAGSVCDDLKPAPGVKLLGRVDDLEAVYARAKVVINPMQMGTGLKIKSIEALGQARALVTSPAGAEGLRSPVAEPASAGSTHAGQNHPFIEASSAEHFANAVADLLADTAAARKLATTGHEFAAQYNAECIAPLLEVLTQAVPRD